MEDEDDYELALALSLSMLDTSPGDGSPSSPANKRSSSQLESDHLLACHLLAEENSSRHCVIQDESQSKILQEQADRLMAMSLQNMPAPEVQRPPASGHQWSHGPELVDTGSTFQAHILAITKGVDIQECVRQLLTTDKRVYYSSCFPYAWRFDGTAKGEDGGEKGAGSRLAQLLETMSARNVLVLVSRQCSGPMLGGRRWNHFLNTARDLLQRCGYDSRRQKASSKTRKSKSSKKKKKKKNKSLKDTGGGQKEQVVYNPSRQEMLYSRAHKDH